MLLAANLFRFPMPTKPGLWRLLGRQIRKGAVWVARLIPDGYISGHANQARITTFPIQKINNFSDPKQTVYHSADVITFAKKKLLQGTDESFSFSDVYNPINFGGARFCDARVWSLFRKINKDIRENDVYTKYVLGQFSFNSILTDGSKNPNGFVSNRLPLWLSLTHQ